MSASASDKLSLELNVKLDSLSQGLRVATQQVETAAKQMQTGLRSAGDGAHDASKHVEGFHGVLKEFKTEQVQNARLANYFGKELAEIIPGAEGASHSIAKLLGLGLEGLGFGLVLEATVMALSTLAEHVTHSAKLAADMREAYRESAYGVKDSMEGLSNDIKGPLTRVDSVWREKSKAVRDEVRKTADAAYELRENGGAWRAIKDFFTVVAHGNNSAAKINLPSEQEAVDAYQKTLARIQGMEDQKKERDRVKEEERVKRAGDTDVQINQIHAGSRDEILKINAELAAKLRDLEHRKNELEGDGARLRVAYENEATRKIALLRRERQTEILNAMVSLEAEFSERQEKERFALETRLRQLSIEAEKAQTTERRKEIEKLMTVAREATAQRIALFKEEDAARIDSLRRRNQSEGGGEEVKIKTELANKLAEIQASINRNRTAEQARVEMRLEQELATRKLAVLRDELKQEQDDFVRARTEEGAEEMRSIRKTEEERIKSVNRLLDFETISRGEANRRIAAIQQQADNQRRAADGQYATTFVQSLTQNWSTGLSQMLQGTYKWGNLVKNIFGSIGQALIAAITQAAASWVTNQALMAAGDLKRLVTGKALAVSGVAENAAVAGAGAASAMASIPYVGPGLALAAMAEVSGAVLGTMGALASARGGWSLPWNEDPLIQGHRNEMMLPEKHANVIRDLADRGGGGGTPTVVFSPTIHAMDGASVRRVLKEYEGEFVELLNRVNRNNRRT